MPKTSKYNDAVADSPAFPPLLLSSANLAVANWTAKERLRYDLDQVVLMQGAFDGADASTWWTVGSDGQRLLAVEAKTEGNPDSCGWATHARAFIPPAHLRWLYQRDTQDQDTFRLCETAAGVSISNGVASVEIPVKRLKTTFKYPDVITVLPNVTEGHLQWPLPGAPWSELLRHLLRHAQSSSGQVMHLRLHIGSSQQPELLEFAALLGGEFLPVPVWGALSWKHMPSGAMADLLTLNEGRLRQNSFHVGLLHALAEFADRHTKRMRGPDYNELHMPRNPAQPLFFRSRTADNRRVVAILMPTDPEMRVETIRERVHAPGTPGAPMLEAAHINPEWGGLLLCAKYTEYRTPNVVVRTRFETSDLLPVTQVPLPPPMNADAYLPTSELQQALEAAALAHRSSCPILVGHHAEKNMPVLTVVGNNDSVFNVLAGRLNPATGANLIDAAVVKMRSLP